MPPAKWWPRILWSVKLILTQKNKSCPHADSVYRPGPSPARGFVCYVWPAGGHLGWTEEQPHPIVHLGCGQLQLYPLQPCGSKTVTQALSTQRLQAAFFFFFVQFADKTDSCLNLCCVLLSLTQTELLASCASDRSIVLYDMRESTPLKKVAAENSSCFVSICSVIYHLCAPLGDNDNEEQHTVLEPHGSLLLHSFQWGLQVSWSHPQFCVCVCMRVYVYSNCYTSCVYVCVLSPVCTRMTWGTWRSQSWCTLTTSLLCWMLIILPPGRSLYLLALTKPSASFPKIATAAG